MNVKKLFRKSLITSVALLYLIVIVVPSCAQQLADWNFIPVVEHLHVISDHVGDQISTLYTSQHKDKSLNIYSLLFDLKNDGNLQKFTESASDDYNVSDICMNKTLTYFDDLLAGERYAIKMLDATAKIPPGIISLNIHWMGSYDQCMEVTTANKSHEEDFGAQFCQASLDLSILPAVNKSDFQLFMTVGVCVPDSCNNSDVRGLINSALSLLPVNKPVKVVNVGCSTDEVPYSGGDVVALIVCSLFLLLALVGTSYDVYCSQDIRSTSRKLPIPPMPGDDATDNGDAVVEVRDSEAVVEVRDSEAVVEVRDSEGLLSYRTADDAHEDEEGVEKPVTKVHQLLMSFSVINNWNKIFDISNTQRDIQILHGIRSLSMWWVILGHSYAFLAGYYDNLLQTAEAFNRCTFVDNLLETAEAFNRWTFQAISNATFSVDSFFFLSGLLVTYLALKYMRAENGQMRWGLFYLHRYLRLTPVYAFLLMIFSTLATHLPRVPQPLPDISVAGCSEYWWSNLLYINNFVPLNDGNQCFGWAWYLANDMQFFVISPVILIALYRKPRVGLGIIAVLMLLSLGITGFIWTYYGSYVAPDFGLILPTPRHFYPNAKGFDYTYSKPYTRIPTYLVGMVTGFVLYQTGCKKRFLNLKPIYVLIGWILAWGVALAVLYGLADDIKNKRQLSYDVISFYMTTSRLAWSLSLAWMTLACVHGYGGPITSILEWKFWVPVSRLTYCAYLVHPIWLIFRANMLRNPVHFDDITMIYIFIGDLVLSYALALVVSVLVEAPLLAVEKLAVVK